jgi:SHS2 domain-containing protein
LSLALPELNKFRLKPGAKIFYLKKNFSSVKNYELIEHTADIGIRVGGANLAELFSRAAEAMFDIIAEEKSPLQPVAKSAVKSLIKLKADSREELFIDWLNELLSLSTTKEVIFSGFKFKKVQDNALEAELIGQNIENYQVKTEIKAATHHQLRIEKITGGWQAEVIFDV